MQQSPVSITQLNILFATTRLFAGLCEAVYWQKLTYPYELQRECLPRVWCRQNCTDCCTGFTFSRSMHLVDGGKLKITQGSHSFTVAVLKPSHGDGMYWCGVKSKNDTIIKLAEGYFHSFKNKTVFKC
uniref:uncharacterized protein si:ch211-102c2.4 n=1 Tax=Scatophagus argus TaxID=75038 RepID=UPI001ED835AD|nr:uncharacterized protein si:ch211-102c2.4 [Scatophagus argus]